MVNMDIQTIVISTFNFYLQNNKALLGSALAKPEQRIQNVLTHWFWSYVISIMT